MSDRERPSLRRPLLVFALAFLVYNANLRSIAIYDSRASRYLPFALLTTGRLAFDGLIPAYLPQPSSSNKRTVYWMKRSTSGHWVSRYPVVTPLLVTPLYAPAAAWMRLHGLGKRSFLRLADVMEKVSASTIAAASVALVFTLLARTVSLPTALLLTFAYGFATATWSISSQALWPHGTAELLLAGILFLALEPTPRRLAAAALLGALAAANRPPDVLFLLPVFALMAARSPRTAMLMAAPVAIGGALLVLFNLSLFGSPLGGYAGMLSQIAPGDGDFLQRLAGLLVSAKVGLLSFSPFLIFLGFSFRGPQPPALRRLIRFFLPVAALEILLYSSYQSWTGGASYGPRFLSDILPLLVVSLAPAVERARGTGWHWLFVALVAWGCAAQAVGAFCYPKGSSHRLDIWQFDDPPYLREARAGLAEPVFLLWMRGLEPTPAQAPIAALAPASRRAHWTPLRKALRIAADSSARLALRVTNRGEDAWPSRSALHGARGAVRLACLWLESDGRPISRYGPRSDLPDTLAPGAAVTLFAVVDAPAEPGMYQLQCDLAQEGFAWFEQEGWPPFRVAVEVVPATGPPRERRHGGASRRSAKSRSRGTSEPAPRATTPAGSAH